MGTKGLSAQLIEKPKMVHLNRVIFSEAIREIYVIEIVLSVFLSPPLSRSSVYPCILLLTRS